MNFDVCMSSATVESDRNDLDQWGERLMAQSRGALNAAGFVTAYGAHSIAAGLGVESLSMGVGVLTLAVILAVYDIAEVILKPVFGYISDRVGVKPVIVIGLAAFAAISFVGLFATTPIPIALVRFGQGAAAAAFSPAASSAVARLSSPETLGRHFGRYGSWKGLGYTLGPLIGAGLILVGGFPALFLSLAVSASAVAIWVAVSMPALNVLPRPRYTVLDLARQIGNSRFLIPVAALAVATGSLGVAVGFLPLIGSHLHLNIFVSVGAVTVLALTSSLIQPRIGRLRDTGRLEPRAGIPAGMSAIAAGLLLVATIPSPATIYVAALLLGAGIGTATTLGFTQLATTTPHERMGRTMGTAELGREAGDAGGPLLVGAIASVATLGIGLAALGGVAIVAAALTGAFSSKKSELPR
ncbi:MAG: MFS transporter [Actinomycetota bacterium]